MKIGLTLPIRSDVDARLNIEITKKEEELSFDSICYVVFNTGKKLGKLFGSIRFLHFEI